MLGWPLWLLYVVVFTLTLLIGARLVVAVVQVAIATRRRRAHHRMVVDLLGRSPTRAALTRTRPAHPGRGPAAGLLSARCAQPRRGQRGHAGRAVRSEIAAILSHERAHLRARHDLVLEMFTAVHAAFPDSSAAPARWTRCGC